MNAQDPNLISFKVVEASSEHADYPASNLPLNGSIGKGWQSEPSSPYPQHLILEPILREGAFSVQLSKIQLLMHESKIPQKIELFVASPTDEKQQQQQQSYVNEIDPCSTSFRRLGYITLDNNENSNNRARELKSISLGNGAISRVKLLIHSCHDTVYRDDKMRENSDEGANPLRQVGIMSIALFGKFDMSSTCNSMLLTTDTKIQITQDSEINLTSKRDARNLSTIDFHRGVKSGENGEKMKVQAPISSKRIHSKPPLNDDIQSSLSRLETLKHEMAEKEYFDSAAKIKNVISKVRDLFDIYKGLQSDMSCAAASEDYFEASRIKTKRDDARSTVFSALKEAERSVLALVKEDDSGDRKHPSLQDLSLSAITNSGIDVDIPMGMGMGMSMSCRSFPRNSSIAIDDRPILSREDPLSENDYLSSTNLIDPIKKKSIPYEEDGKHPLEGVPDFINLPIPEEIHTDNGMLGASLSSSESNRTSDSITKIESIIGIYCARCFLSKNWVLREAALIKTSIIIPEKIKQHQQEKYPETETILVWWESFSRAISTIIRRAVDDRIVQVFLTGLLLLDDCVAKLEEVDATHKYMRSFLKSIVPNLIGKLSDGNYKVAEGAEIALTCLAFSKSVGPTYISMQTMILITTKDKSGRSYCSRLQFLRSIIEEFGEEGPKGPKVMEFIKECGFGHKDADVRDAAKDLSAVLFARDGNIVVSMLDGLSDRQLKEYKTAFAKTVTKCELESGDAIKTSKTRHDTNSTIRSSVSTKNVKPKDYFPHQQEENYSHRNNDIEDEPEHGSLTSVGETPIQGRGRGRGRGRVKLWRSERNIG